MPLPTADGKAVFVDAETTTAGVGEEGVFVSTPGRGEVLLHGGIHVDVVMAAIDGDERARLMLDPETGDFAPPKPWRLYAVAAGTAVVGVAIGIFL